jgi:hypothetical protein
MIIGVSTGELQIGDNWQTKSKQCVWPWFDGNLWINLDSDALLKQNCHTQKMKRTIIYGAKFNLSSSFSNHTVVPYYLVLVSFLNSKKESVEENISYLWNCLENRTKSQLLERNRRNCLKRKLSIKAFTIFLGPSWLWSSSDFVGRTSVITKFPKGNWHLLC